VSGHRSRAGETTELLQTLIRNACVNDGDPASGQEVRNADTIAAYLGGSGLDVESFEAAPGRVSLVARIEGSDPDAASLCLMGHTDVVPVNPEGWDRDPFGGELVDGEVWGRGAIDMLNLTASMAVAFRHLAETGFRPRGDLIFFAVADEEAGSQLGAQWMADHHWDAIRADYVLTEGGGIHGGPADAPVVTFNVAEKGVSWRRLTVHGEPGHGSMPFRSDNALATAAAVVTRLQEYSPGARVHELWGHHVAALDVDEDERRRLLDPVSLDASLVEMANVGTARHLHACSHTTFSPNVVAGGTKTNVIPDRVQLDVDIRTLPGEDAAAVAHHLQEALGPLAAAVDVETILDSPPSTSRHATPLWESLQRAVGREFPEARLAPNLHMGFTDARVYRARGVVAYGAGLYSPEVEAGDFASRFHGHNERVDVESLRLTTDLWSAVARDLLA
jgi:acetylornithine deacetylase/succinyl-diaminopimelate desuccinylase-like protein